MILILSQNEREIATEFVLDWLTFFGSSFRRFNGVDIFKDKIFLEIGSNNCKFGNTEIDRINVVWNRRWMDTGLFENLHKNNNRKETQPIVNFIYNEIESFRTFFNSLLDNSLWVDSPNLINVNKLQILKIANIAGLNIPHSIVSNNLSEIKKFINQGKTITKPLSEVAQIYFKNIGYFSMDTKIVSIEEIKKNSFLPSLFQRYIEKKFEIRSFYLDNKLYSMAIFSQNNNKTKIDFRNYDRDNPNRTVPYIFDINIENTILKFVSSLGLKCCSLDFICDKNNNIIFLEVNPVGQFGMVSLPCNYHLEYKLAKYLNEQDEK